MTLRSPPDLIAPRRQDGQKRASGSGSLPPACAALAVGKRAGQARWVHELVNRQRQSIRCFVCSFAHTPSNAHPAAQTTRLDTVKNSPPLLYLLLTGSFVRSFILPKRVPSIRPAGTTRQGKSHVARIGESQARKKKPRLAPSCLCLQASYVHISPITFQAVRAKGCEPFGCFEHTSSDTHSLPMHTVRRTRLQTGLAQIYQYPLSVPPSTLPPGNAPLRVPRIPSDNHGSSAVPIRHPSRPVTSSPPGPASPSRTVLPCLVLLLYKETFPQPHTQLGTCYRTTVLRVD